MNKGPALQVDDTKSSTVKKGLDNKKKKKFSKHWKALGTIFITL